MYCRVLQLDTGDMIIGIIDIDYIDYSQYTVCVFNPVKIDSVKTQQGGMIYETFVMKNWLPMMDGNSIYIQTSKVVFDAKLKPQYEEQYRLYIDSKDKAQEIQPPAFAQPQQEDSDISEDDEEYFDDDPTPPKTIH